jgi:hypothetical protein
MLDTTFAENIHERSRTLHPWLLSDKLDAMIISITVASDALDYSKGDQEP